jgi:ABC-type transport system involved in cytochrome bd biosynthesis fused ATPase/permease subunit
MVETGVSFEDELIRAMQEELESALADENSYAHSAEGNGATAEATREKRKKAMLSILAASVRTQRLYFVVRALLMSLLGALITFLTVAYLGSIGVVQAVLLGMLIFVASLIVSRLFDKQIVKASKRIISALNRHKRARAFVLKNL